MGAPDGPLDFSRRWMGAELMDDPSCDESQLLRTIAQFTIMNRLVSRYRSVLERTIVRDMSNDPRRAYHLVDVGAGGCDIPVWLLRRAKRRGLRLRVTAIESDPRTVAYARNVNAGVEGLTIEQADIMDLPHFSPIDYIFSNHVLHHLPDAIIPEVFSLMHQTARRQWIVSDLYRSPWAYAGFQLLGRFFHGSFTFEDGKRSIRRSFVESEIKQFAHTAGLSHGIHVERLWPVRMLITGSVHLAR